MSEYQEKLRSIGFPRKIGQSVKKPVVDERDGSVGGYETEHWDGRQDAHVQLKPLNPVATAQEGA